MLNWFLLLDSRGDTCAESHVCLMCASMTGSSPLFPLLHLVRRLRPYLPADCLARVVHALVISCLDYCNALYVGLPLKVTQKLQLIQNAAAGLVTGSGRRDYITPILKDLHWVPDVPGTPECPFVQYRTLKKRLLRAATLPRLVEWLVSANVEGDLGYVPSFLATYRAFANPAQVLELLLPRGPDKAVLHVLELWLQHHPGDFWEPPQHPSLQRTLSFLRQSARDSPACTLAEGLWQSHKDDEEQHRRAGAAEADGGEPTGMGLPQVIGEAAGTGDREETPALLSFSVDEVAEQLTLIDAELFRAVRPFHCLGCVWSQRDKKENQHVAPSVRATVAQFNAVTSSVIASVLGDLTLRFPQRAHLLEKWIDIAQRCRALRNFSSLHAILSALQSNSIYRLKRTWAAVHRDTRGSFRKLLQIFSEDNNYLKCREILLQEGGIQGSSDGRNSTQPPAGASPKAPTIPYLGTFLTDLIMLDTALPDFVESNLINFEKRRKEAVILSWICQLQDSCQEYNLCPNPSFRLAFHHQQQLSEEQSYRISRVIEPPADSCPNSPKLHRSLTKRFSSLLLGSEASAAAPSPEKPGISPLGSYSSLSSEDMPSTPCSPTRGLPTSKLRPCLPLEQPPPSPISKQRGTESRIIRVSMDDVHGNGNLYRSIVITSQDKTTAVVQRALQKHNLEGHSLHNYRLLQLLGDGQELLIPDGANAFYAMNPAGPHDFLLCHKEGAPNSIGTMQPGSKTTLHGTHTRKDRGAGALAASSSSCSSPHLGPSSLSPHGPTSPQLWLASCLLAPPFPSPSSRPTGTQQPPSDAPSSPPSPLPLSHHSPFGPALSHVVLPSSSQRPKTPASSCQSPLCYSSGASRWSGSFSHCDIPRLSASQTLDALSSPDLKLGTQGHS
ncbi:ral guanine nucleotide dissociation stimulator-like 3 isoform X2 [Zootoca vivipara]|uniref:ral guanine nucleotide dissociation stimulator-like 3 isoform X2 n=1 Tax=Zootoca vivipara TaxID=8524 RepID=UPI00293BA656|nr:ral guanine nucleotide dissociation stimulator-like 3 isoform X2 [Zootoca vivipara]